MMSDYNGCKLAFFQAAGALSDDLQDAEREYLILQGMTPGTNQDMWMELLGPAYTDTRDAFWITNGCQPD